MRIRARYLKQLYPQRGKLIELGCGMGFLLKAFAEDGWDVTGIEPDRGFCDYIERKQGLRALPAILEDSGTPDNSVDVVVFLHVIEHVPDPLATLQAIFRVLKPGGHLVLETPRYDSLMFKLLGKRERSLELRRAHLFLHDRHAAQADREGGLQDQAVALCRPFAEHGSARVEPGRDEQEQGRRDGASQGLATRCISNKLHLKINMRDMQRIVVQKPA